MKYFLIPLILLGILAPHAFAELTQDDLNKIRLIVKEATTATKADVAVMKTEMKNLNTKIDDRFNSIEKNFNDRFNSIEKNFNDRFNSIEKNFNDRFNGIEKNFDRQSNLIIACIAIPMALIAILVSWRSIRDNAQSKQIEELTHKVEVLEKQRIASP